MGRIPAGIRLPMTRLAAVNEARVLDILNRSGVLA